MLHSVLEIIASFGNPSRPAMFVGPLVVGNVRRNSTWLISLSCGQLVPFLQYVRLLRCRPALCGCHDHDKLHHKCRTTKFNTSPQRTHSFANYARQQSLPSQTQTLKRSSSSVEGSCCNLLLAHPTHAMPWCDVMMRLLWNGFCFRALRSVRYLFART